ncbi:hypothetical protein ACTHGU_11245 [Chitinophagaceae bacterium MMS25-I14]
MQAITENNLRHLSAAPAAYSASAPMIEKIRKQIRNICRNRAIDARIRELQKMLNAPAAKVWADMDDAEREKQVRITIAIRHAIERMVKMKR